MLNENGFSIQPLALVIAALMLVTSACAYRGFDDPASRKLTWFSYLNGDDIRAACVPGSALKYRFVYNADYEKQFRTYDIIGDSTGDALTIEARVIREPDHSNVTLSLTDFSDLEGSTKQMALGGAIERAKLDAALVESRFFEPAPKGLSLRSNEYYWVGVVCKDGKINFNAYKWPSSEFDALTFPAVLFEMDKTGVAVRGVPDIDRYNPAAARLEGNRTRRFSIVVGDNGLRDSGLGI